MINYDPSRPVLFLDVDGVLNDHPPFDGRIGSSRIYHDKVKLLNVVLEHTGAQVVLSSAWRYFVYRNEMDVRGLSWLLRSHGMWNRMVGITRADTMVHHLPKKIVTTEAEIYQQFPRSKERGEQIDDWIALNGHRTRYAVVDDGGIDKDGNWCDLGIKSYKHPVVWTESKKGLTAKNAAELCGLLGTLI